jgi:NAD(P)-dependent dehydrogenase (short-subunit alcohol dehydrogenase family)
MILEGRVAVVTGAGSGIGRGGAEILASEGAIVVATDLSLDKANQTVARIRANGGQGFARKVDVAVDQDLEEMIRATLKDHGRIDILHNHAGIQVAGSAEQVEPEGMDLSYQINTRAHYFASRLAIPHMKKQGQGVIINTASNSGVFYDKEMLAYTTSKAATIAMTRQMAVDYAKFNIRINALCPGWVDTSFNEPYIAQMGGREAIEKYVSQIIPIGRWALVEEIAESILFLASSRSAFMTGHALVVDGGECLA